jgi:hypothetical protein
MILKPKYCSECGEPASGKFCSSCGHRLVSEENEAKVEEAAGPWQEECRYAQLVKVPEVRGLIERHARLAVQGVTGEQFLSLAENLVPTGVPLEKLAKVANSLYKKWGIGTGKTRVESVPLPVGEAIVRVVCSMARRGQAIRQVQQANNGCRIESAFPSDFFSLEGDFIVTVERISSQTMVTAQTRIGGQWFDWGKSKRGIARLFDDLAADPANVR